MTIVEQLSEDGRRLFAARSIVPLVMLPFLLLALPASWHAEVALGTFGSRVCEWMSLGIALTGLCIRAIAVAFAPDGSSSRETHRLRATSLNRLGMYSVVRHPLYLGSGLMWVGTATSLRVWWLAVIVGLIYSLYLERLMVAEEAFLEETFGGEFTTWAAGTPAFWPRWSRWSNPAGPVQWRRVLSEHNGLLAVAVLFAGLQYAEDLQFGGEPWAEWYAEHFNLVVLLASAFVISICSISIRKWARGKSVTDPPELERPMQCEGS